jgi:lipoyl(octanoyl) transferase
MSPLMNPPLNGTEGTSPDSPVNRLIIRTPGQQPYRPVWEAMRRFTDARDASSADELWSVSHPAIFTQGQAGKPEHLLAPGDIPVIQIDRGGQVTYHGPGQLVIYLLVDLRRLGIGARQLVELIEQSLLSCLRRFDISAETRIKAPGVYVNGAKIAALGLRIRRGCSYHGLSLNVAMDLSPFQRINPCGYQGMAVTSMLEQPELAGRWTPDALLQAAEEYLLEALIQRLGHTHIVRTQDLNQPCPTSQDAMS